MWEWSRTVAERAAAAVWSSRHTGHAEPTVVDPESWRQIAKGDPRDDALYVVRTLSLVR